ncbi:MAG: methyltransferase domain-containing protein [Novosphingobium sp.]
MSTLTPHNETIVDQHTRQASGYAELTRRAAPTDSGELAALLGATANDQVLDVACGPGSLALQLAPHVAQVTGLDLTPAMLDQAREAQQRAMAVGVRWIEGDAAAMPFADGSFDLVASRAAFHHFERPAGVLAEMARVCRSGGRVVVIDVTPDAEKTGAYDRMEAMRDPSHRHAHCVAELRGMGQALGLDEAAAETRMTGPMPYRSVLATSFPEGHSRDELLALMREDAEDGRDLLGFRAQLYEGEVLVTYRMTTQVWQRP